MQENTEELKGQIQSHPDVNLLFYPEREYISSKYYIFDYPESANYRIGILVDPCRFNAYNCCMNVFGQPEYPALLTSNLEAERSFKYNVIADDEEVAKNYFLVYEDGSSVATAEQRAPDDFAIYNESCVGLNDPNTKCVGRNYAFVRSPLRPPCVDNNYTLDILEGCYDPVTGEKHSQCIQVAYTSNTFIPQCNEWGNRDEDCGTYLEVHIAHGTPYTNESDIISDVLLDQRNVSGYYTTMLPTTWMGNSSKVLCSYTESVLRIGSLAYVKPSAPVCCCPPPFQTDTRVGSFFCPIGPTDDGPYAYRPKSLPDTLSMDSLLLDYPFCPIDISANIDRIMCSAYDARNRRAYTRNCTVVTHTDITRERSWTSVDMVGEYDGLCSYYDSCAMTLDAGKCFPQDRRFTFIGQVGIVTALDNEAAIPQVWLTFNDGRTSYQFSQEDVKLETYKSMYEIWWVVRSKSWSTVQKRKGFNITSPACTFDTTNNRYLPYTILKDGEPMDNSPWP